MALVMLQNCEMPNSTESNGLKRIFANKGNCEKKFGAPLLPQVVLTSSIKPILRSITVNHIFMKFFVLQAGDRSLANVSACFLFVLSFCCERN